jgi:glyoxylate reductase
MNSVFVTRRLPGAGTEQLNELARVDIWPQPSPIPRAELLRLARGQNAMITMLTEKVDEELLDAAGPQLRVVANYAVGYDNIDVDACDARGVIATHTPDVLTDATADATWALILAAARRIVEADALQRGGQTWTWAPDFLLGRHISGKTLGIVGFGRIGQAVARRAAGFEMEVLHYSRPTLGRHPNTDARAVSLDELLSRSDVVSVHLPASPETHHFFGDALFARMKRGAVFVNTARGSVVDEQALAEALADGRLFAAGLDVFENEPQVPPRLRDLSNTVLTPHIASATEESRTAMAQVACANVAAVLRNQPPLTPINRP